MKKPISKEKEIHLMGFCVYCGREWNENDYKEQGCCSEINGYTSDEEVENVQRDGIDQYKAWLDGLEEDRLVDLQIEMEKERKND